MTNLFDGSLPIVPCVRPLGVAESWVQVVLTIVLGVLVIMLGVVIIVLVAAGWAPSEVKSVLELIAAVIVIITFRFKYRRI